MKHFPNVLKFNSKTTTLFFIFLGLLTVCIHAQSPGDRLPLNKVHPGYTLSSLMPTGFQPGVSGLDFLSNGKLVVSTWGGDHNHLTPPTKNGDVYILDHVDQEDPSKVTVTKFASGLQEPLGLKVLNDTIYITERQALAVLIDKNNDGVMDTNGYRKLASYITGTFRHEFFFGLIYKDGYFYGGQSLSLNQGPAFVPQPEANRGTYLRIEKATGKSEYISGGAREPFGFGMNSAGEIFSTEVQGTWNPACAFTQVKPGRFYGHPLLQQVPPSSFDTMPYQKPAVLLPETDIANAPGQPLFISSGIFKNQFFYGDVSYGGIQRIFLEKIENEYQGAVFRFSAGFTGGVSRLAWAPNGDLIVGEIGDATGSNWQEFGKQAYGLEKLKSNGKTTFEMLAIRSRPKGMEIEFTEPVGATANVLANYKVLSWHYTRTSDYGGSQVDLKSLTVSNVTVSTDRKKVYLEIGGLEKDRLIYIRLSGVISDAGKAPWSTESWYTLNAFGTGNPFDSTVTKLNETNSTTNSSQLNISQIGSQHYFQVHSQMPYTLTIHSLEGKLLCSWTEAHSVKNNVHTLRTNSFKPGSYTATLRTRSGQFLSKRFVIY